MTVSSNKKITVELDARHLLCPMPVIKTQQAISDMEVGEVIRVVCTDPGVKYDIPAWVRVHGHSIVATNCEDDEVPEETYFEIRVN